MSSVTVGFVPRERFSLAPESLQTILDSKGVRFNLFILHCATPDAYWSSINELIKGRDNVTVIETNRYCLPNECRNLILQRSQDEFICLIENDNLVDEQWLSRFLTAVQEHQADVIIPLIMEGRPGNAKVHFDESLGQVRTVETSDGAKWEIAARSGKKELDIGSRSRPQEFMETHCLFFRRSIFEQIGYFDPELNTS